MKAGILYPSSKAYPNADLDFVEGIKSQLLDAGLTDKLSLIWEGIGIGGNEKEVYSIAEKLLRLDKVDLMIAFVDLKVSPLLEPLFFANDKLLIVVNPGANYPSNWLPQPNIIYLSLEQAYLNWLCGKLAASLPGTSAAIASSFYDCGYLHASTNLRSFMQGGGLPAFNGVNRQSYDQTFEIKDLVQFLKTNPSVQKILCTYDSLPAFLFYQCLQESSVSRGVELFVSAMMLEASALAGLEKGYNFSITGFRSWLPEQTTNENQQFLSAFQQFSRRPHSLFALLGWECGIVLESLFRNASGVHHPEQMIEYLSSQSFDTPRGILQLDPLTNHFLSNPIQCRIAAGATQIETTPFTSQEAWAEYRSLKPEGIVSGWLNTYLCY